MKELELVTTNLCKQFDNVSLVLDNINISLHSNKIYGFVGRNGSGKTVLLKLLCGLMKPSKGAILLNGQRVIYGNKTNYRFGIHFDNAGFIPGYSGKKNLLTLASIQKKVRKKDVENVFNRLGMIEFQDRKVREYSYGMKQKLSIAQSIMENPDILILDEPMNGLDQKAIQNVRDIIVAERNLGKMVLIATHVEEDIKALCDSVYRVANGSVTLISPGKM